MIDRRGFLRRALIVSLAAPLGSCVFGSAASKKIARVGYVAGFHDPATDPAIEAFLQGVRDAGYVEGKDLQIDLRYGEGDQKRYAQYVADLIAWPADVLASSNNDALRAMRSATSTIPIVFINTPDPLENGWVQSLARPGGNLTGVGTQPSATTAKRLEYLKEISPSISRVATIWDGEPTRAKTLKALADAARDLGVDLVTLEVGPVGAGAALARALDAATSAGTDALLLLPSQIHIVMLRKEIVDYATGRHIVSSFPPFGGYVEAGGLMAYGENFIEVFRRAATVADRILKGADPALLPVELPSKFDLVINQKAAKAIGLTIPQSILSRATQVLQ